MRNPYKIAILFISIYMVSCSGIYNEEPTVNEYQQKADSLHIAITAMRKNIIDIKQKIESYNDLRLAENIKSPEGLVICEADPNYYTYLTFNSDSTFEDYYEGPNGTTVIGTWTFKNDTIYYNSKEYERPQKIPFKEVIAGTKSLSRGFEYCIVEKK